MNRKKIQLSLFAYLLLLTASGALFILNLPVNYLEISDENGTLQAAPVPLGCLLVTSYIHSVQLSPVIDEYALTGGAIWSWEERVQSHNAGLPFAAPRYGSFVVDPPWMIVRGGRHAATSIAYRIGTAEFGRNTWHLSPFAEVQAFEIWPSKRVFFHSSIRRLADASVISFLLP